MNSRLLPGRNKSLPRFRCLSGATGSIFGRLRLTGRLRNYPDGGDIREFHPAVVADDDGNDREILPGIETAREISIIGRVDEAQLVGAGGDMIADLARQFELAVRQLREIVRIKELRKHFLPGGQSALEVKAEHRALQGDGFLEGHDDPDSITGLVGQAGIHRIGGWGDDRCHSEQPREGEDARPSEELLQSFERMSYAAIYGMPGARCI